MSDLSGFEPGHRVLVVNWCHDFEWKDTPGAGFCFPCLPGGALDLEQMPPEALESWERCHGEYAADLIDLGPRDQSYSAWVPAHGTCACGRDIVLTDPLWNGCDCGRWYNQSGQEVISPEAYERDVYPETGESLSDIYNGGHDGWDW